MMQRLRWITIGGLAFWLPIIASAVVLREKTTLLLLNIPPLVALVVVGLGSWFKGRKPGWAWMLAGIYILGPTAMLAPSLFTHPAPSMPGDTLITIAFCLFPPMTLWMAVLNGTIISVLIASVALAVASLADSHT